MMALVKSTKLTKGISKPLRAAGPAELLAQAKPTTRQLKRTPSGSRREKASERMAAATEQLASGLTESASAAEELRRAMEQIAAGADEAAGGSHEQMVAIKTIVGNLGNARSVAETSRRRTEAIQLALSETAVQIVASVRSIEKNAERQQDSVSVMAELEKRADDIGQISETVSVGSPGTELEFAL